MEEGVKRKRKIIQIEFEAGRTMLKVLKISGKHLESMGVPCRGGFELYPEEAAFLVETGSAVIFDKKSGHELTILDVFCTLERMGVDHFKYEIYKQIKRTGLVILRPRSITKVYDHLNRPSSSTGKLKDLTPKSEIPNRENKFERNLVDENFPTIVRNNFQTTLKMKKLHVDRKLVGFLGPDGLENFPTERSLSRIDEPSNGGKRFMKCGHKCKMMNGAGRLAASWKEFEILRNERIKHRNSERWGKRSEQIVLVERKKENLLRFFKNEQKNQRTSVENVDFHVFSPASFSHRLPVKPIFSVVCFRAHKTMIDIEQLEAMQNVVMAIEEAGKVNYLSISGDNIDLNQCLEQIY